MQMLLYRLSLKGERNTERNETDMDMDMETGRNLARFDGKGLVCCTKRLARCWRRFKLFEMIQVYFSLSFSLSAARKTMY